MCRLTRLSLARQHTCMENKNTKHRPGNLFIDRYMPKATEEAREEAYANLRALVALLVRIDERLALEERERLDLAGRRKILD
jgi:hypothetical protein